MKRTPHGSRHAFNPFRAAPTIAVRGADDTGEAEIQVYDYIGWGGVEAKAFTRELKAITAPTIHVRINTPGGDVFDGVAIANALRDHPSRIVSHIDALAASMGSIIALAGDEVRMAPNAFYMIHDPWSFAIGNASDLRKTADVLEKIGGTFVETYMAKTKAKRTAVEQWMHDETWFTAAEALAAGFVDVVEADEEEDDEVADAAARFDLSVFANLPEVLSRRAEAPAARSGTLSKKDVERALREAGASRSEAKAMTAKAFETTAPRDADPAALNSGLTQLLATISPPGV